MVFLYPNCNTVCVCYPEEDYQRKGNSGVVIVERISILLIAQKPHIALKRVNQVTYLQQISHPRIKYLSSGFRNRRQDSSNTNRQTSSYRSSMELSEEHMKTLEMDCSEFTVRKVLSSGSLLPAKLTCIGKGLFSLKGALHYGGFSHKSSRLKTLWSLRPQSMCLRVEAAW